ncbi:MAG: DNA-processing protein DprA [Thermodesulfobacteriota bacterium]
MDTPADKLLPWFTLKHTSGIGNHLFKRLLDRFGTPESVLAADSAALEGIEGVSSRLVREIKARKLAPEVKKDLELVLENKIKIVTMCDPGYPPLLLQIPDPPPFLYVRGSLADIADCIAVVGSRNATQYGLTAAERLCEDLAAHRLDVISGMAVGIDTAAHLGALNGGGRTVAVLGSGLARMYPASNRQLAERIARQGAVVSEFPMLTEPEPFHFPLRNRIISGMALGTIVVEATKNSGSLITARLAAEQGREVFAVPGSIRSFKSTGTHSLLKQGARLVEQAADVLEEIAHRLSSSPAAGAAAVNPRDGGPKGQPADPDQRRVLAVLSPYPQHIDVVAQRAEMSPGQTAGILLQLELSGLVRQSPGKLFCMNED